MFDLTSLDNNQPLVPGPDDWRPMPSTRRPTPPAPRLVTKKKPAPRDKGLRYYQLVARGLG